ncbi:MAG: NUDIX hydrolase [Candidatus Limnocylindrales bacterium]
MAFRPDLVDVWIHRIVDGAPEVLLLRRAPGRSLAGLWQGVSGSLEPDERVTVGALRELVEETGFGPSAIEAFYDLDLVNQFHWAPADAIVSAAVFAVRVRPGIEPILSHEHDAARWAALETARAEVIWPGYRVALGTIGASILDPDRAHWFELDMDGRRRLD